MNKRFSSLASRYMLLIMVLLISDAVFAQGDKPEMADLMRSNGKIYVVVAVCLTILIGLFIYVFLLDRKIRRLENNRD
jgi:K+-transporting ATPase A subunit